VKHPTVPADIRRLTAQDAEAFSALRRVVTAEHPVAMGLSMAEELSRPIEGFRTQLASAPPSAVFGAFVAGELVATAGISATSRFASSAHKRVLWGVFTNPAMRRQGLSRALVEKAIEHAFTTGARRINLLVYVPNEPALALYRSLGFVECGTEPEALLLDGAFHDGVNMTLANARQDRPRDAAPSAAPIASIARDSSAGGSVRMDDRRFNVFGRIVLVRRESGLWQAYDVGADGKRSPAAFVIPDFIEDDKLEQFLFDLFHERATPGNGDVRRIP
jgi:RimJ/RimL family protein N-acetyltransferase